MNTPSAGEQGLREAVRRKASFGQTVRAVAWSFFGVRRGADYQEDVEKLNPIHVIVAGILGGVLFVFALLALVRWVLSSGVAQ
jgi:hypothetical protein